MKRADQVLSVRGVDTGLPADSAVDLRKQGGRNLNARNAPPDKRGHETGDVADHAAAERNDEVVASDAFGQQPIGGVTDSVP